MPNIWGIVVHMEHSQWERLGAAVLDRRTTKGWTQQEVSDRGGPSDTLQTDIESKRWKPIRNVKETLKKIDAGMRWEPGSAKAVLEGDDPTPIAATKPSLGRALAALIPHVPQTPHDDYFERAERLLRHSHESVRQGNYLGAIHSLEGAESTVELLIDRISDVATQHNEKDQADDMEVEAQPDASTEAVEAEEALADVSPEGDDIWRPAMSPLANRPQNEKDATGL